MQLTYSSIRAFELKKVDKRINKRVSFLKNTLGKLKKLKYELLNTMVAILMVKIMNFEVLR